MIRFWPWAGGVVLLALLGLLAWLWFEAPYLVNPVAVSGSIQADTLPASTAVLMAAMLPVVMLAFLIFALIVVVLAFAAFGNERRLLRILRRLESAERMPGGGLGRLRDGEWGA